MNWTLEDSDRIDDDILIESTPDYAIYSIDCCETVGYGVMKGAKYWVKYHLIKDLPLDEIKELDANLFTEAKQFAIGISPNQLALF
jgi:hypothetical protein